MYTLFEVLLENIQDNKNLFDKAILQHSIKNHLNLLLNSRQGSLQHLPEYGLSDLNIIYQGLPDSIFSFSRQVCKIIERYEPRLSEISVIHKKSDKNDCIINLEIRGKIKQYNNILLDVYFLSGGEITIESEDYIY